MSKAGIARRHGWRPTAVFDAEETLVVLWWLIVLLLAGTWVVPMLGMKQSGCPWWIFTWIGSVWMLVGLTAGPIYDWGNRVRRILGMVHQAEWGERLRPRFLPLARVALLLMALISFAVAAL